jgi:two-component system response regulator PilR (NtrC family)
MAPPLVLVVDDEPDLVELVTLTLARMQLGTQAAGDVAGAKKLLKSQRFDLCLTDMRLPDGDGLDLLEWMGTHCPEVPCAVITAHGNVESAVRALKLGAFDWSGFASSSSAWRAARHRCTSRANRARARNSLPA